MTQTAARPERAVPRVVLVTSPACHHCDDAHHLLEPFAADGRIELHTVEADSADGAALLQIHRPAMFPLVLVDGEFLSSGRLPRGKLARVLGAERTAV